LPTQTELLAFAVEEVQAGHMLVSPVLALPTSALRVLSTSHINVRYKDKVTFIWNFFIILVDKIGI
jgi:hypothetical protein